MKPAYTPEDYSTVSPYLVVNGASATIAFLKRALGAKHVHLFVPDVDAAYRRAIEAGATSVQAPVQKLDDEDKRGGVKDDGGTTWWISTRVG